MKIELITKEEHEKLLGIYQNHPILTLQNKGYEGINKDSLEDEDRAAIKEIEEILNRAICGFSRFQNFRLDKNEEVQVRFQYNYNYDGGGLPFTGVGYILLDELLNGFKDNN